MHLQGLMTFLQGNTMHCSVRMSDAVQAAWQGKVWHKSLKQDLQTTIALLSGQPGTNHILSRHVGTMPQHYVMRNDDKIVLETGRLSSFVLERCSGDKTRTHTCNMCCACKHAKQCLLSAVSCSGSGLTAIAASSCKAFGWAVVSGCSAAGIALSASSSCRHATSERLTDYRQVKL